MNRNQMYEFGTEIEPRDLRDYPNIGLLMMAGPVLFRRKAISYARADVDLYLLDSSHLNS